MKFILAMVINHFEETLIEMSDLFAIPVFPHHQMFEMCGRKRLFNTV